VRFKQLTSSQGRAGRFSLRAASDFSRFLWGCGGAPVCEASVLQWLKSLLADTSLENVLSRWSELRPFLHFLGCQKACPDGLWNVISKRRDLLRLIPPAVRYNSQCYTHSDKWRNILFEFELSLKGFELLPQARALRHASDFAVIVEAEADDNDGSRALNAWITCVLKENSVVTVMAKLSAIKKFCTFLVKIGQFATNPVNDWRRGHGVSVAEALRLQQQGLPIPKPAKFFCSALAPQFEGFVAFKRCLGRKYAGLTTLVMLDRHLALENRRSLTDETLRTFLSAQGQSSGTRKNIVGQLRQFLIYLQRTGANSNACDLAAALPQVTRLRHRPCILTIEQLSRILLVIRQLPLKSEVDSKALYAALHLTYACGLRISEVCNLQIQEVNFEECTLFIRQTKFGKDRLIPFGDRVRLHLTDYLTARAEWFGTSESSPWLFVLKLGQRLSRTKLRVAFNYASRKILGTSQLPRIHDLRHMFAVHRLYKWYLEGADPLQRIVLLSLYMGHVDPEFTQHYLHLSHDLLRVAGRPMERQLENWLGE